MTTLREAAQQALEALEYRDGDGADQWKADVIATLRAALAEPTVAENATTQQPLEATPPSDYRRGYWDGFNIGKREGRIEAEAALAEPMQEPRCHVFNVTVTGRLHEWEPTTFAFALRDGKHALYTAPSQRKPLTDEEIYKMYNALWRAGNTEAVAFVRAIERAHGIGGNNESA